MAPLPRYFTAFPQNNHGRYTDDPESRRKTSFSSVLTLPNRISGSKSLAASSNAGAITWHDPHHEAQKSTTNRMSLCET
jgi:hypothetical protein